MSDSVSIEEYVRRVSELLEANSREAARRRAAVAALRHLREGFAGRALIVGLDGKLVSLRGFIDAAIAAAEAPPGTASGDG